MARGRVGKGGQYLFKIIFTQTNVRPPVMSGGHQHEYGRVYNTSSIVGRWDMRTRNESVESLLFSCLK